jgi:hypothetical protein
MKIMGMDATAQRKAERLEKLNEIFMAVKQVSESGRPAIKKKLAAYFCITWGNSRRTIMEYIQVLIDTDKIEEREDGLWIPK